MHSDGKKRRFALLFAAGDLRRSLTQCVMLGTGEDDEDAEVVFLVVGGEFYKRHDI